MALGNVPRCQHIKINGTQCGSPALHRRRHCFFHQRAREQHDRIVKDQFKQARFVLPVLEDANAVQMALMQVMQMLVWGQMDRKTAGLLLYGLQTASANLRNVDFEPSEPTDVVIDREQVHRTDIGGPQWDPEDFEWDEEEDAEEEAEDSVEETDAETPAAAQTVDSPAASADAAENTKPEPTMDQVRKQIRGLVHNYIMEAGGDGRALS
ncbi:MAG: hypothetical protein WCA49_12150 [Candidatus Sulfotelmatobacter sp.]